MTAAALSFPGAELVELYFGERDGPPPLPSDAFPRPPAMPEGWLLDVGAGVIGGSRAWYGLQGCSRRHGDWYRAWVAEGDSRDERYESLRVERFSARLTANGWPWYAQSRVGQRTPKGSSQKVDTDGVDKTRGVSPRWLAEAGADDARWREWLRCIEQRHDVCNAALALSGPGSMYCWALDSDVDDAGRAARLDAVRLRTLGPTPYGRGRHGSARMAWLYRMDGPGALDGLKGITFKRPEGADRDRVGKKPHIDAVEVLASAARSITLHGRHHESGAVLEWDGPMPGVDEGATPDLAPVVTRAQVEEFLDALRAEFGDELETPARHAQGVVTLVEAPGGLRGLGAPAGERATVDRNNIAYRLCSSLCRQKANLLAPAGALRKLALAAVKARVVWETGWEDLGRANTLDERHAKLKEIVKTMLVSTCGKRDELVRDEGFKGYGSAVVGGVEVAATRLSYDGAGFEDREIRALVTREPTGRRVRHYLRSTPDPAVAAARALLKDRTAATTAVGDHTASVALGWVRSVAGARGLLEDTSPGRLARRREASAAADATAADLHAQGDHEGARAARRLARDLARAANGERPEDHAEAARAVHLLRSPTGAGKTTAMLRAVLAIKSELARVGKKLGPILFMAPSYSLLDDIVQRASGMASPTADVQDEVARVGAAMQEAKALGLKVMVYKGKAHHCEHPAYKTLAEGGVGTGHICRSQERYQDPSTGEWRTREVVCPLLERCGFWLQRAQVADQDIVFLPSAYLTLPIPEEVRAAAVGLVVDESMVSQVLASCHMPVDTLSKSRPEPTLSKRDKAAGVDGGRLVEDRHAVCAVARRALLAKEVADRDPANALVAWGLGDPDVGRAELLRMLDSWVNVVGRAMDVHASVNPFTTALGAEAVVARRRLEAHLGEEHRLAKVVRERIECLLADEAYAKANIAIRTARGAWDHRLQVLRKGDEPVTVRVSWRRRNSFADLPMLLTDASSDVEIVRKLFQGRKLVVHEAPPCAPHLRVLLVPDGSRSDTSLTPWRDRDPWASAEQVDHVRRAFDAVSLLMGAGRVAAFSTKRLEVQLQAAWERPYNIDWLHYGGLVGLDHMRRHAAAVIVGRMELPIGAVDAQVAALTYDDDEPELPIDRLGTLLDARGNEVRATRCTRVVEMRDGSDLEVEDASYAGAWARRVQAQAREEQVRQAIGRLRPMHRTGEPPLVVLLGRVVPSGLVVDAVASLRDVASSPAAKLAADLRRTGILRFAAAQRDASSSLWLPTDADRSLPDGTHPAMRGMAQVAWRLADDALGSGGTAIGFVPAFAVADGSMGRRLALYASLSRKPSAADPALRVLRAPAMDEGVGTREECPKMRALIGDPAERRACESAAMAMAARVTGVAAAAYGRDAEKRLADPVARGRPQDLTVLSVLLSLRPRAEGERPYDVLAPFVVHEKLPATMRAALEAVLAEDAAGVIEGECVEFEPEPAPAPVAANDIEALYEEAAALFA